MSEPAKQAITGEVDAPSVMHVPFGFFPDASGGTEVYVLSLAKHLVGRGFSTCVAAPGPTDRAYAIEDIPVYRFALDPQQGLEQAYGAPDIVAATSFAALVNRVRPAIVHLHARTAAVSDRLVDIAHRAGARVIFTYHTPTVSCARGTMLLHGRSPCDGVITSRRCIACAMEGHGAHSALAGLAARVPAAVAKRLAAVPRLPSALRVPGLLMDAQARFGHLMSKVDHVVAVCDWVADVLRANHVPGEKLTISRQGLADTADVPARRPSGLRSPIRIAYFGRLDPTKGIDLLVSALALIPAAPIALDLYLVRQPGSDRDWTAIEDMVRRDQRVTMHPAVPSANVRATMAGYDLIAVPSRWLETGPLVVLEAFSAGVPVLGADRGGIAELVRDGIDGILFAPEDVIALARAMERIAVEPERLETLRDGVRPPRMMSEVADEMAALYGRIIDAAGNGRGSSFAAAGVL